MLFDGLVNYDEARAFMTELRSHGIECGETPGGVTVFDYSVTPEKQKTLLAITRRHGAVECPEGRTFAEVLIDAIKEERSSRPPRII